MIPSNGIPPLALGSHADWWSISKAIDAGFVANRFWKARFFGAPGGTANKRRSSAPTGASGIRLLRLAETPRVRNWPLAVLTIRSLRVGGCIDEWHLDFRKAFSGNDIYKESLTCVDGFAKSSSTARMRYSNEGSFRRQFDFLRRQFLQDGELPFTDVLSREAVTQGLDTIENAWNDSIYTPLVTLWVFLVKSLAPTIAVATRLLD